MESVCRTCIDSTALRPLFPPDQIQDPDKLQSFTRALYLTTGLKIELNDGLPQNICRDCFNIIKTAMQFRTQSQVTEKKILRIFKCTRRTSEVDCASSKDITKEKAMLKAVENVPEEKPMLKAVQNIPKEKPILKAVGNIPEKIASCKAVVNVPDETPMLKAVENVPQKYDMKIEIVELNQNTDVELDIDNDMTDLNTLSQASLDPEDVSSNDGLLFQKRQFSKIIVIKKSEVATERKMKIRRKVALDRKRYLEFVEGPFVKKQPVKCKICNKCSKTWNCFKIHVQSHLGSNILCEFCGKPSRTLNSLLRHHRARHGLARDNKFPCSFCGFQAIDKEQLEVHERRIHTKERPFTCDECGANFFSKRVLIQHTVNHRPDKPYQCDVCPSRFKLSSQLSGHKNRVHKKKRSKFKLPHLLQDSKDTPAQAKLGNT